MKPVFLAPTEKSLRRPVWAAPMIATPATITALASPVAQPLITANSTQTTSDVNLKRDILTT